MRVDAATLGLVFSALSTLVVVAGALAAIRQLRHLRTANEIAAIGKLIDDWTDAALDAHRTFIREQLPLLLEDPAFANEIVEHKGRAVPLQDVGNFFERLAIFARSGAISEELAMLLWGSAAAHYWELLAEPIAIVRAESPTDVVWEYFEDFAVRAPAWLERHARHRDRLRRDPRVAQLIQERSALPAAASRPLR